MIDLELKGAVLAVALLAVGNAHAAGTEGEGAEKTEAAPATAVEKPKPSGNAEASEGITAKIGGWSVSLYGYAALNVMHDSTQSFGPSAGNTIIQPRGTFRGHNDQLQFTVRDSRLGLRLAAPAYERVHASANIETDFSATQPVEYSEQTSSIMSTLRMRHYYMKVETPIVDVLAGQYHDLFGWGGKGFYPSTLAFLGITGQVYHRQAQLRISKVIATDAFDFEVAAAAMRPVQRASGTPDVEAGLRFAFNRWKGMQQQAYSQPHVGALSVGVSGIGRRFEVAEFLEFPGGSKTATGWGFAINGFIPVIPATDAKNRGNSLSLTGEFSQGTGIADMYNADLTGGALFPTLTNPQDRQQATNPPPVYTQNIDSGIVTFDGDAKLRTIDWRGYVVGLQYYLPVFSGRIWVSGNFSRVKSANIVALTPIPGRPFVYSAAQYYDANLFIALTDTLQTGYSFQAVEQTFGDGVKARNYRNGVALHFFF